MNETLRTFLDASELSHNGPLLLGAVKTAGGRGGEGREGGKGGKGGGGQTESKVQRGDVDSKVKGRGKRRRSQKKRGGEKPGRKDTRVTGRKEEEGRREGRGGGVSPLQKKMRQKGSGQKSADKRGKTLEEVEGEDFDSLAWQLSAISSYFLFILICIKTAIFFNTKKT